jgi:hypothetical protein
MYHGILDALGGANDVSYAIDPATGQMVQHTAASGPGTQWKRIISGALTGYAAGAGITGPGSTAAKFGRGFQVSEQKGEQQEKDQKQEATADFERGQKLATSKLQNSFLAHNIARSRFELQDEELKASEREITNYNEWQKLIGAGGQGTKMVGNFPDSASAFAAIKANPELQQHLTDGEISLHQHVEDGMTKGGIDVAIVTPNWGQQLYHEDLVRKVPDTIGPDGEITYKEQVIPKDSINNDIANKIIMSDAASIIEKHKEDIADRRATAGERTAAAGERRADAAERQAGAAETRAGAQKEKADFETGGGNTTPAAPGTFDPAFPPPQNFPPGTPGILLKNRGKLPAASQKNASLARLIEHNTAHALQIIKDHGPELQGAITGRESELKEWAGSDNAYLRMLAQDIENIAMPTVGIHGSRSQRLVDKEGKILFNDFKAGPNAVAATLLANLGSARTYLNEEKNFLNYGTATGPDRKLQKQVAPAAGTTPGQSQVNTGTTPQAGGGKAPAGTQLPAPALAELAKANGKAMRMKDPNGTDYGIWQMNQAGQAVRVGD